MIKRLLFIALIAFAIVIPVAFARGADYLPKDKNDGVNVVVGGEQEYKNLYVGGSSVLVQKQILGDLFSVGGNVNVAGPIEKDLFAFGGSVVVGGQVGDNARVAGGNITVNSAIKGDLLAAGGTVSISKETKIGGDFWAAGGLINLNSTVTGNVKIAGNEVMINGPIAGDLTVRADKKLVFGPESRISGAIKYSGRNEAVVQQGAQIGKIEFTRVERKFQKKENWIAASFGIFLIIKIISLLIVGLIILKLFSKTSNEIISNSFAKFWTSLGIGFLALIVIPIIFILLMITMIGFYAGAILIVLHLLIMLFSGIFSIFFIGAICEKWIIKKKSIEITWRTIIWGLLAGTVVSMVPLIGGLTVFILFTSVYGSILMSLQPKMDNKNMKLNQN